MNTQEEEPEDYISSISIKKGSLEDVLPPCDKFNCPKKQECKESLLACEAFHFYVQTNKSLPPTFVWHKKKQNKVIGTDSRVIRPTMKRYWKIYRDV